MIPPVHIRPVPGAPAPDVPAGACAVVFDVLRATSTICAALRSGAAAVRVCAEPEDALRERAPGDVLGGERRGVRIGGFDLGNSPREYTPERVRGRRVVFTTTNGTRALLRAGGARDVLIGALVNRSATAGAVPGDAAAVHLICAGTGGEPGDDDLFGAGALAWVLCASGRFRAADPDVESLASSAERTISEGRSLARLRASLGAARLVELGFDADIEWCARVDACPIVARFDPAARTVVPGATRAEHASE